MDRSGPTSPSNSRLLHNPVGRGRMYRICADFSRRVYRERRNSAGLLSNFRGDPEVIHPLGSAFFDTGGNSQMPCRESGGILPVPIFRPGFVPSTVTSACKSLNGQDLGAIFRRGMDQEIRALGGPAVARAKGRDGVNLPMEGAKWPQRCSRCGKGKRCHKPMHGRQVDGQTNPLRPFMSRWISCH